MRVWFAGGGTGGHLYPGLAIARAMVAAEGSVRPFFIGARRGIERELLPAQGFEHELLDLHPLYRSRPWENWQTIRGAFSAWRRLGALAAVERPRLVVGTGGYAAGLALAYAALHRIPLVLQEANSHPGLTVRAFARFARELYLGYPEAAAMLHAAPRKLVDAGSPIEAPPVPLPARGPARARWGFPDSGPRVLLIFGGSQGARGLNKAVAEWVRRGVPEDLRVIWGTGRAQFDELAPLAGERVVIRPYLSPITDAYAAADLALTRAGAMTTAELSAWGIPMILVPLPTAAADHQTHNAVALERAGAAIHLPQREANGESLARLLGELLGDPARLRALGDGALRRARPDAARLIAARALTIAKGA